MCVIGRAVTLVRSQYDSKTKEACLTVCIGLDVCVGASYCKNMNSIIQDYIQNGCHYYLKHAVL